MSSVIARQRVTNSSFQGSGALGAGDRGGGQTVAFDASNPYNTNDFVRRWRSYVQLYETSWEARKIIRIIPEDALRKDWIIEDMPEEFQTVLLSKQTRLKFRSILMRSLKLERLLGGCLTFMGLEETADKPEKAFNVTSGKKLHFLNAIPISRISRINWDTDPLSEYYMRPDAYLINGQRVHASRCLVWDGEPLFDPYDFALTNFRVNLAGFGPSKLAPIWDDITKAVGTRQAAYQLIQTNNAILIAVNELQDLQGTKSGKAALAKVRDIANQISAYRAAVIDADKVDVQQRPASFGSVPELILTFIQILSAASDIPATRFLGQAPGGLNATGESDLENYYNVIDAYQRNHIEPNIRRIYDTIGFSHFKDKWRKIRDEYTIKFPPMWNASELEEAQAATARIDNVMKLFEQNLIKEEKVIEEINAKNCLSVDLDKTDIEIVDDTGMGEPTLNPQEEIARLKGKSQIQVPGEKTPEKAPESDLAPSPSSPTPPDVKTPEIEKQVASSPTPEEVDPEQLKEGLQVEQEHAETVGGNQEIIKEIALDHLEESPTYYTDLEKVEAQNNQVTNQKTIAIDFDGVIADYSEGFQGEDIFGEPLLGVAESLKQLKDSGWKILIHTSRKDSTALREYFRVHDIPYDSINENPDQPPNTNEGKPVADIYVDDRGLHFKSWMQALKDIQQRKVENAINLEPLPEPTEKQIHSGNYKKHHLKLHGLDIAVENPQGSTRSGVDQDGTPWEATLPAHYGYVKRTEGADGDEVDVFIGPQEESELVFVVDQNNPDTGEFDEHKVIFGTLSMTQAKELYQEAFTDGKASQRLGGITPMHVEQFKQWLKEGNTKNKIINRKRKRS